MYKKLGQHIKKKKQFLGRVKDEGGMVQNTPDIILGKLKLPFYIKKANISHFQTPQSHLHLYPLANK